MFFKVLLIVIGIYLLGKLIIRSVVSWFLGDTAKKMNDQMRRQQDEMTRMKKKKDGHVTVHYQPKKEKNFGKEDGDYVDFEEVK
jgi:hypothetical protein